MSDREADAIAVGQWLGANDAPVDVIAAQERVAAALTEARQERANAQDRLGRQEGTIKEKRQMLDNAEMRNTDLAVRLSAAEETLRTVREALRALVDGQSVQAFIGYSPSPETAAEIEAKFDHGRAALAATEEGS